MKISLINRILLNIEIIPVIMLLILSFFMVLASSISLNMLVSQLSILSLISLIIIIRKTLSGTIETVNRWFVYLSHLGVVITVMGLLVLLIDGNGFKSHTPNVPYSAFSFGVVAVIPYLHVMIINNFFMKERV